RSSASDLWPDRRIWVEARKTFFSLRIASIASLGLPSQLGYLDQLLFGKVVPLSQNPSARQLHFRRASPDYTAHQHFLDRPLFDKVLLLSVNPLTRPLHVRIASRD